MKITILVENSTSRTNNRLCASEWGFSVFIETRESNILFDTGHSDIYINNAKKLGIDLQSINYLAISHRHWDHVEGLLYHDFKDKKKIVLHPIALHKSPVGVMEIINNDFDVVTVTDTFEFSPNCYFLGEIPRVVEYETGEYKGEQILDDTALAFKTKKGVVVVTGCSHSGISNICEYAKKVTNQKLHAVIGGFHLFENDPSAVAGAIEYFKKEKPDYLYPMHCLDLPTLARFYNEFGIDKLGAGDIIEFEEN
jgi:7,8-dihydropterin-6-yl-methyl-4-(beta-D-ribofuranosyl)aminobenzene 5'-phosphate synthase